MNRKFDEHLVAVNNLRLKKNSQELISIQIDFLNVKEQFSEISLKLDKLAKIELITHDEITELDSYVEIIQEPTNNFNPISKWDLNYAKLNGFWKGHSKTDYWNPTGISFNSTLNEIVFVDSFNHCLKILDPEGTYLRSSQNEITLKLKTPRDLFIKDEKEKMFIRSRNITLRTC